MKQYISFFKLKFKTGLQYKAAAIAGLATQIFFGFVFIMVYVAFYGSGTNDVDITLREFNEIRKDNFKDKEDLLEKLRKYELRYGTDNVEVIELTNRINYLIENEKLRQQMSNAATIKAKQYSINNITSMWMQLFTTLHNENK